MRRDLVAAAAGSTPFEQVMREELDMCLKRLGSDHIAAVRIHAFG
jgi:hypothetical protein